MPLAVLNYATHRSTLVADASPCAQQLPLWAGIQSHRLDLIPVSMPLENFVDAVLLNGAHPFCHCSLKDFHNCSPRVDFFADCRGRHQ